MDSVRDVLGPFLADMLVCDVMARLVDEGLVELGPRMPVGLVRAAVLDTLEILPASVHQNSPYRATVASPPGATAPPHHRRTP